MLSNYITNIIVEKFIALEIISRDDKEIYCYSYQYIIELLLFCFSLILISIPLSNIPSAIIFIFTVIPLRTFAGGIHAPTKQLCSVLSYILFFFLYIYSILYVRIRLYFYNTYADCCINSYMFLFTAT